MLCKDAGLQINRDQWIALNFKNESVDYDCVTEAEYELPRIVSYNAGLRVIAMEKFTSPEELPFYIRPGTIRQFSNIAATLDAGQVVEFGVPSDPSNGALDKVPLSKEKASRIQKQVPEFIEYYGAIQGIIHALHKESDVASSKILPLSRLPQPLVGVLPHRLQHAVPGDATLLRHTDERLLHPRPTRSSGALAA